MTRVPVEPSARPPGRGQRRRLVRGLNGFETVTRERGARTWRPLVDRSKYSPRLALGDAPATRVLRQDHGNRASFRGIEIKELT